MVVVRIYEGLGNQMFEYAYAYALSKRLESRGIKVYIDVRDKTVTEFDKERYGRALDILQFNIKLPRAEESILRHWTYINDKKMLHRIKFFLAEHQLWKYKVFKELKYNYTRDYLQVEDNTYVVGWFQHYQYFEKYRNVLLKEFTYAEEWCMPEQLKKIMRDYQVASVHVRRGDYIKNSKVRKLMCELGEKYYQAAVVRLQSELTAPYLFIFTDDEEWVEKNLEFEIPNLVVSNHYNLSALQEMVLMSQCNHNIIANSTFSWWGAWLNMHEDKIVIAPKKWFVDKKRNNIAMKNWILV
ncbi:MAG: alpha-1,2-fucosyltransferase [Lachnospiraceae bacterium]|nr:alpha-1,2-fucosyltransferase [Lachnospiraceae bacterium]